MKPHKGPKSLIPCRYEDHLGIHTRWNWRTMPYGCRRRQAMLQWLRADRNRYIAINKKWCIILKRDPDLKRLIKQGKLVMLKNGYGKNTLSILKLGE